MKIGKLPGINDVPPPQGLSLGTAGQVRFILLNFFPTVLIRRGGVPFRCGGVYRNGCMGVLTSITISDEQDFHLKSGHTLTHKQTESFKKTPKNRNKPSHYPNSPS